MYPSKNLSFILFMSIIWLRWPSLSMCGIWVTSLSFYHIEGLKRQFFSDYQQMRQGKRYILFVSYTNIPLKPSNALEYFLEAIQYPSIDNTLCPYSNISHSPQGLWFESLQLVSSTSPWPYLPTSVFTNDRSLSTSSEESVRHPTDVTHVPLESIYDTRSLKPQMW